MRKNVLKLLVFFLSFFILINGVNASLNCENDGEEMIIEKEGIKYEGYTVRVPYCYYDYNEPDRYDPIGELYDTYQEAYDSGLETELAQYEDADGKGTHLAEVYVCSNSLRKVQAHYSCTTVKKAK